MAKKFAKMHIRFKQPYLFFFQATDALVAAVDFNEHVLITGFEDTFIALWSILDASPIRKLSGHVGNIIKI